MSYLRTIVIESVALLGSLGTLLCCALPALLVSIGAGAVMASLVSTVPQLVWLSEHKIALFTFAGVMLLVSGVTNWANRRTPCPLDPVQAKSCRRARRFAAALLFISAALYVVGFYFAFIAMKFAA
jgi:predicted small integral membrane protein